jgi:hypothetical protein
LTDGRVAVVEFEEMDVEGVFVVVVGGEGWADGDATEFRLVPFGVPSRGGCGLNVLRLRAT